MRREITGFSNPLLKEIRGLREKKLRKRSGLFLAEGLRIMTEAREAAEHTRHLLAGDTFELDAHVPHAERYGAEGAAYWVARRNA